MGHFPLSMQLCVWDRRYLAEILNLTPVSIDLDDTLGVSRSP